MRKIIVIFISLIVSFVIMTAGYGLWTEELTIEGNLVLKEDPEVIAKLEEALSSEQRLLDVHNQQLNERLDELQKLYEQALAEIEQQQATDTAEAIGTPITYEIQNNVNNPDDTKIDENQENQENQSQETTIVEENEVIEPLQLEKDSNNQETNTEVTENDTSLDDNIDASTDNGTNDIIDEFRDHQIEHATTEEQEIENDNN